MVRATREKKMSQPDLNLSAIFTSPHPYNKPTKTMFTPDGAVDLIQMVNRLEDKLASTGYAFNIPLPRIVVVGSQCAGKSSVLENIVGKEFLPRGQGTVTRRPTIVKLIPCDEEFATFLHKPGVKFTDFNDVKHEIIEETNRNPGPGKYSSEPISLEIHSPHVLEVTLVDLPGFIKITLDNQSENSPKEIRDMTKKQISDDLALILAVSEANMDISNSEALEIAKEVDPKKIRTIGVLTKLDLMDKGTNAREILENKKNPLVRGYIGVLNRSQQDIVDGRDIAYILDKEEKFFASMPCYRDMADRMGTVYLRKFLNEQLYIHIKEHLPNVRRELSQKLAQCRQELKEMNDKVNFDVNDPSSIQRYKIKLTQEFIENLDIKIFGYSVSVSMDELSAGAMIKITLYKSIENLKIPEVPAKRKLLTVLANSGGVRTCFTMPSLSLETVFHQLLSTYIEPLNMVVNEIADILCSAAEKSSEVLGQYPNFKNELNFLVRNCISEAAAETKETLKKHLEAEMYFVNTCHKDFIFPDLEVNESLFPVKLWKSRTGSKGSICTTPSETDSGHSDSDLCSGSEKTTSNQIEAIEGVESDKPAQANTNILAKTIEKSIDILHKHVEDMAFKYILFFLVKRVMDFVKKDLLGRILNSVDNEIICRDCEKDFNRMKELEAICECLEDAENAVQTF